MQAHAGVQLAHRVVNELQVGHEPTRLLVQFGVLERAARRSGKQGNKTNLPLRKRGRIRRDNLNDPIHGLNSFDRRIQYGTARRFQLVALHLAGQKRPQRRGLSFAFIQSEHFDRQMIAQVVVVRQEKIVCKRWVDVLQRADNFLEHIINAHGGMDFRRKPMQLPVPLFFALPLKHGGEFAEQISKIGPHRLEQRSVDGAFFAVCQLEQRRRSVRKRKKSLAFSCEPPSSKAISCPPSAATAPAPIAPPADASG